MTTYDYMRRVLAIGLPIAVGAGLLASICLADPPPGTREPIQRVDVARAEPPVAVNEHPLVPAIRMAQSGLVTMDRDIKDYSATLVKRERVNGTLNDHEFMSVKIRNGRVENGQVVPFSVYMKFLKPASVEGREVVYVQGENNGKLRAHEGGVTGKFLPSVWLLPDSFLAMKGQRYPITEVGLRNLIVKLIERANDDIKTGGETQCSIRAGFKVNGRECTLIQVVHPKHDPRFTFHLARIYVDSQLNIPIRYEAYSWPEGGGKPGVDELIEEYTYVDVKVNQGFTNADFDSTNKAYNF